MSFKSKVSIGDNLSHWTVASLGDHPNKVDCVCVCGIRKSVNIYNLLSGKTTSCGCVTAKDRAKKHGLSKTPEYQIWKAMKARCYNPNHKNFDRYGGRGIQVCNEWVNDFARFFSDVGQRPSPKHSIDRIDNDKNYSADNCRWGTQKEQTNNTSRSILVSTGKGSVTVGQLSSESGIDESTIYHRRSAGWSDESLAAPLYTRQRQ